MRSPLLLLLLTLLLSLLLSLLLPSPARSLSFSGYMLDSKSSHRESSLLALLLCYYFDSTVSYLSETMIPWRSMFVGIDKIFSSSTIFSLESVASGGGCYASIDSFLLPQRSQLISR